MWNDKQFSEATRFIHIFYPNKELNDKSEIIYEMGLLYEKYLKNPDLLADIYQAPETK